MSNANPKLDMINRWVKLGHIVKDTELLIKRYMVIGKELRRIHDAKTWSEQCVSFLIKSETLGFRIRYVVEVPAFNENGYPIVNEVRVHDENSYVSAIRSLKYGIRQLHRFRDQSANEYNKLSTQLPSQNECDRLQQDSADEQKKFSQFRQFCVTRGIEDEEIIKSLFTRAKRILTRG